MSCVIAAPEMLATATRRRGRDQFGDTSGQRVRADQRPDAAAAARQCRQRCSALFGDTRAECQGS